MEQDVTNWLYEGIIAAKAGQYSQARSRLLDVVEIDPTNEVGWFWLYQVSDRIDDKLICLENLITLNPHNEWARNEWANYRDTPLPPISGIPQIPTPDILPLITLRLVTAFWGGISFILISGGIMGCSEWLVSGLRSRMLPYYITLTSLVELMAALVLLINGVMGIVVTIGLFFRSSVGFYGSLLLALGLLLLGPLVSLMSTPPNYFTMVCLAGVSGVIVLLTLASLNEFQ